MREISDEELPVGWIDTVLSSLGSVGSSKRVHKRDWKSQGVPFFRAREIAKLSRDGAVDNDLFISHDLFRELSKEGLVPTPGDVMITGVGTIGVPYVVKAHNEFYFKDASVLIFKNERGLDSRYLSFYLKSLKCRQWIVDGSTGTTVDTLTIARARDIPIPLAPLAEQKRIADKLEAVLGRVDACRARLDRVPALLKRFRQSVLASATSGGLTAEWRMTYGVNDEWEETQIQHVANVGTGSTPLRSNSAFFAPKGTPWVTSAATSKKLVTESEEFVTDAAIKAHRLKKYPVGTLLVAMYGEGKTRGQVTELGIEATINQACAAIVVNESIITKRFVKFSLEANYLEMRELAEGGNQPNLNLSKIKEFPIGLPTLPEQQEIVRRVEDLFAFADRIEARLATAQKTVERLTPATLAKAFRGELVPQDPNDEPASALLERLRSTEPTTPAVRGHRKAAK